MDVTNWGRLRINVHSSFSSAQCAWRRFEDTGVCYAFQSYDWMSCWYACIGKTADIAPCLVEVEAPEAGPLLFLPMGVDKRRGLSRLIWLGGRASDYHAPILGSGFAEFSGTVPFDKLWSRIRLCLPPVDAIHLEKQPEQIEGHANPFVALKTVPSTKGAHAVVLSDNWDGLYRTTCSKKTMKTDRWKENKLSRLGAVAFGMPDERFPADMVMDRLIEIKRLSNNRTGASDAFHSSSVRDFYRRLSRMEGEDFRSHLSFIRVGEEIAAVHWGVIYRGRFYYLMPAFDEDRFSETSPGILLVRRLLEWSCGSGLRVFDFGLGDEPYKDRWCDSTLRLWDYLTPITLSGRAYVGRAMALRTMKRILRLSPAFSRIAPIVKRAMNLHAPE